MPDPLTISKTTLLNKLFDWRIDVNAAAIYLPKEHYVILDESWLAGEFSEKLRPFLAEHVGNFFDPVSGDPSPEVCEDFAEAAAFFCAACWRKTSGRPVSGGPAFGPFAFRENLITSHSLNAFTGWDGSDFTLRHYEPQTQRITILNPREIASCFALRMGS